MSLVELTAYVLALVVLIFLSGYFSASESALFSLSSIKIKAYRNDPDRRKQLIAHLILQPRDLLVTIFMLNTIINIFIQNVASSLFGESASWYLKVGVPLVLVLFLGEIFPKTYGLQNNQQLSYRVAPSIHFLQKFLKPIRKWTIAITAPISKHLFFFLKKEADISKDELKHVLKTSEEQGVLPPEESKLIWGYISLQDMSVKELMHPREDLVHFDINDPLSKLPALFKEKNISRIPVTDKGVDNLLGIISVKKYFLHQKEILTAADLRNWLGKPFYVPENAPGRLVLKRMNRNHEDMAIVVDEYGSISGLITKNDILEVILGYSLASQEIKTQYTQAGKNEIIASGKLELAVFNEIFSSELQSETNMVTIGGWLTEQLDELPKSGTKYQTEEFLFHVLAADPNRIRRIYIRKLKPAPSSSSSPNSNKKRPT